MKRVRLRIARLNRHKTKETSLRIGLNKSRHARLSTANLNRKKAPDLSLRSVGRRARARQIKSRIDRLNGNRRKAVSKNVDLSPRKRKNAPAKIGKTGTRAMGKLKRFPRAEHQKHRDPN